MARHAGPVILLGGWLLMQPPSPSVGRDGKWTTPIGAEPVPVPPHTPAQDRALRELGFELAFFSRCVPAEAVYPPAQPQKGR